MLGCDTGYLEAACKVWEEFSVQAKYALWGAWHLLSKCLENGYILFNWQLFSPMVFWRSICKKTTPVDKYNYLLQKKILCTDNVVHAACQDQSAAGYIKVLTKVTICLKIISLTMQIDYDFYNLIIVKIICYFRKCTNIYKFTNSKNLFTNIATLYCAIKFGDVENFPILNQSLSRYVN